MQNSFVYNQELNNWVRGEISQVPKKGDFSDAKNLSENQVRIVCYNVLRPSRSQIKKLLLPHTVRFAEVINETLVSRFELGKMDDVIVFCECSKEFLEMLLECEVVKKYYSINNA